MTDPKLQDLRGAVERLSTDILDLVSQRARVVLDIAEVKRRRTIQEAYNAEHGITPQGIRKAIKDITEPVRVAAAGVAEQPADSYKIMPLTKEDLARLIRELETQMKKAAKLMDFERAALLRDRIIELKRELIEPEAKPNAKR